MTPFASRLIEIFGSRHGVSCATGLSSSYVANLLQGRRRFSLEAARSLRDAAETFGVTLEWRDIPLSQRALAQLIEAGALTVENRCESLTEQ